MTVAELVVLHGLQTWGQPDAERCRAWQGALDVMGLAATVTITPPPRRYACTGTDAAAAMAFIDAARNQFPLGKYEHEVEMVEREMAARTRGVEMR